MLRTIFLASVFIPSAYSPAEDRSYNQEPISAACIIEVSKTTGQEGKLVESPAFREAARAKVRKLSAMSGKIARAAIEFQASFDAAYAKLKDEFDHGIATKAELDQLEAKRLDPLSLIVSDLKEYPSCRMLEYFPYDPLTAKAKALAGQ